MSEYVFQEFPKWVYKGQEGKVAANHTEYDEAVAEGWEDSPEHVSAPAAKSEPPKDQNI